MIPNKNFKTNVSKQIFTNKCFKTNFYKPLIHAYLDVYIIANNFWKEMFPNKFFKTNVSKQMFPNIFHEFLVKTFNAFNAFKRNIFGDKNIIALFLTRIKFFILAIKYKATCKHQCHYLSVARRPLTFLPWH